MADLQKFLFDFDFDDVKLMEEIVQEEIEEEKAASGEVEEEPEPEVPTFSEEEVETARQEGYTAGKESGVQETLAGIENNISQSLNMISSEISGIVRHQTEFNTQLESDATNLALSICRKLFPSLNEEGKLHEVSEMAKDMLGQLLEEPRISVRVEPELIAPLKEKLDPFLVSQGYKGVLSIREDETLPVGGCKIEWSNGQAERNPEQVFDEIEESINTALEKSAEISETGGAFNTDNLEPSDEARDLDGVASVDGTELAQMEHPENEVDSVIQEENSEISRDAVSESASDMEVPGTSTDAVENASEPQG